MSAMKVAVMGGGNGAHTVAADLALKGLSVNMFELAEFADQLEHVFDTRQIEMSGVAGNGKAKLDMVTSDIAEAVADVEVVFIPLPGFTVSIYGRILAPHLTSRHIVVIMPGTLSALEFLHTMRHHGNHEDVVIAETGGLPFATRLVAPGKVQTFHKRAVCGLATVPGNRGAEVYGKIKHLYPFQLKPNVIGTGLGHLCALLHPAGMLLNAGRVERTHGEWYMYEEGMTPSVVKVIEGIDAERLEIGRQLGVHLPTGVDMMVESGYGPRGTLWESLNGSAGLTPIKGPPSLTSRYVTEDVPYGLVAWASLGRAVRVETPLMDALIHIAGAMLGQDCWTDGRNLEKMGLSGLDVEGIKTYLETGQRPVAVACCGEIC
jgi:opine dehydrogenase